MSVTIFLLNVQNLLQTEFAKVAYLAEEIIFAVSANMKQGTLWKFLVGTLRPVIFTEDGQDLEARK